MRKSSENEVEFDLSNAQQVMMQYAHLMLLDPFRAGEIAESAAQFAIDRTGCTREELSSALSSGFGQHGSQEEAILKSFYRHMSEVQRTLL